MNTIVAVLTGKSVTRIIDKLASAFKGLPHLPKGMVNFLVSVAPWLAGLGGVLGTISGLKLLGNWLGWGAKWWLQLAGLSPTYFLLIGLLQLLGGIVLLLAFNPLKERQLTGWTLLFVNMAIGLTQSLVALVYTYMAGGSLLGTLLGLVIGLYFLFEVKGAYATSEK
jgi:hypothetical protein